MSDWRRIGFCGMETGVGGKTDGCTASGAGFFTGFMPGRFL